MRLRVPSCSSSEASPVAASSCPPRAARRAGGLIELPGDAAPQMYCSAIEAVAKASGVDAVLVVHAPTALASSKDVAAAICEAAAAGPHAVFTCWPGGTRAAEARAIA